MEGLKIDRNTPCRYVIVTMLPASKCVIIEWPWFSNQCLQKDQREIHIKDQHGNFTSYKKNELCLYIRGSRQWKAGKKKRIRSDETYGQGWIDGNEVALQNANANGQNYVISFVIATILCHHSNATSRMLYFTDDLHKIRAKRLRFSWKPLTIITVQKAAPKTNEFPLAKKSNAVRKKGRQCISDKISWELSNLANNSTSNHFSKIKYKGVWTDFGYRPSCWFIGAL